jgi:hypothetical protein
MRRNRWIGLAGAIMAWSALAIPAGAQAPGGDLAKLRREVSDLSLELLRAEAEAAELKDEERLLTAAPRPGGEADARPLSADEALWKEAVDKAVLHRGSAAQPAALEGLATQRKSIEEDQKTAIAAWSSAMERSLAFQDEISKAEALVGWSWNAAGPPVGVSLGLIALGTLAVLGGLVFTVHEMRDGLRWRLRALGSRPSLIAMAITMPLAVACGAGPAPNDEAGNPPASVELTGGLKEQVEDLRRKLTTLDQANAAANQKLAPLLEEVRSARAAHALKPDTPFQDSLVKAAEQLEAQVQEQFQKIRIAARVNSLAVSEAERIEEQLKNDSIRLTSFVIVSRDKARYVSLARLGSCCLFILAAVIPLTRVRRRRRRERDDQSRKCPRCLNKGTLEVDTNADSADATDDRRAKFRLMVCSVCDYEIRENYVHQNRLCFPTVGIRASGKTHWMIMLYDMIKNSNIPVVSSIKKIPSREDARFDGLVRSVLYEGGGLEPTLYGLPYPLTFHVHDADPLGANKSMINLFDFSGEMRNFNIDTNEFRRRALLCDGFVLFLDPAQVSGGSNATIEDQIQTFGQFAEEMHAIRGLSAESPIDMSIAICVSKIDLLVTKSTMSTQAIPLVTALRETLTRKVDLALIHERSQLCARAMPLMFPGWNVERALRESFGGRYMFFPMSAVGLEGAELGVEDLSRRTIAPCGMIEPVLWLLHMHGYCVLH